MTDAERHAEAALETLLASCPQALHIEALQALQRYTQAELARLWGQNASPGHSYQWQYGEE